MRRRGETGFATALDALVGERVLFLALLLAPLRKRRRCEGLDELAAVGGPLVHVRVISTEKHEHEL
jgi:hypothetical protein